MHDRLAELSVRALIERMATSDPVPGGGSAAALAGAMGAALIQMVVSLTAGRETAAASADELAEIGTATAQWQSELLNLAELDANAYAAVVNARRLPRGTNLEREAREVQLAAAMREATRAPLETLRAATAVLELAERLAPIGTPRAISDVGVGGMLAATAARGAALNVRINLPYVDDEELLSSARKELQASGETLADRERAVLAAVDARLA